MSARRLPWVLFYATVGAWLSWRAGQDINWDLLNYHFYTPYELLGGRLGRDIDVAGVQSYMNPLFDLPFFVAVQIWHVRPIVIGVALGAFHGVALWFVHKIVVDLMDDMGKAAATVAAVTAALTAAYGAGFRSEIGGTMGDTTMAVFVLAALSILVSSTRATGVPSNRALSWAGFLLGISLGKLVAAIYVAGFGIALAVIGTSLIDRVRRVARFGLFVAAGMALSQGYWMWLMYRHFGSPLFPYLQRIDGGRVASFYAHYLPHGLWKSLFFPFLFAFRVQAGLASELSFRDARLAAAYVAVFFVTVVAAVRMLRRGRATPTAASQRLRLVCLVAVASYAVWQYEAAYYRYAIPIEALASVLIVAAVAYFLRRVWRSLLIGVPICAALCVFGVPFNWGRALWSTTTYFDVDAPLDDYKNSVVLLTDMPVGYLAPQFPSSTTFLRLSGNWDPFSAVAGLKDRLEWTLQHADRDRIYLLETDPGADLETKEEALNLVGLTLSRSGCQWLSTTVDVIRICQTRFLH